MKLIVFDCDSTLSGIEGIDELARFRGEDTFLEIEKLTNAAMNGEIALDDIFKRRLDIIRPDRDACDAIARLYIEKIEPTATDTLKTLREMGWTISIVSGGITQIIRPLADLLNIERVDAVPLFFNADGSYAGFDQSAPPTRNGGKPQVIEKLKKILSPECIVMVGDGISDLETQPNVDLFIGFGRYAEREQVVQNASCFVQSLAEIPELLKKL